MKTRVRSQYLKKVFCTGETAMQKFVVKYACAIRERHVEVNIIQCRRPSHWGYISVFPDGGLKPGNMGRVTAGRLKLFCQNIMMRCDDESIPDRSRPGLPTTASGVAWQGTSENYATFGSSEDKRKKASEEAAGTVEGETNTHKGWYFKYRSND